MTPDEKFRQAAWTYVGYGLVSWLGGLALIRSGFGPEEMSGGGAWLIVGVLFVVVFPWLLARDRAWFDRWVLSRRDLGRVLTLLLVLRGVEAARSTWAPRVEILSVGGYAIPVRLGAAAFLLLTGVTAMMLARAAWSRVG